MTKGKLSKTSTRQRRNLRTSPPLWVALREIPSAKWAHSYARHAMPGTASRTTSRTKSSTNREVAITQPGSPQTTPTPTEVPARHAVDEVDHMQKGKFIKMTTRAVDRLTLSWRLHLQCHLCHPAMSHPSIFATDIFGSPGKTSTCARSANHELRK